MTLSSDGPVSDDRLRSRAQEADAVQFDCTTCVHVARTQAEDGVTPPSSGTHWDKLEKVVDSWLEPLEVVDNEAFDWLHFAVLCATFAVYAVLSIPLQIWARITKLNSEDAR